MSLSNSSLSGTGLSGSIGFLLHPREAMTATLAAAVGVAEASGHDTWVVCDDPEQSVCSHLDGAGLLVTVGGDGTFLLGARLAVEWGVPVLGVNRGQLGFLTDIELTSLPHAIAEVLAGRHQLQRRSLLALHVPAAARVSERAELRTVALNEVVLKSTGTNLARLRVDVDSELLGDFDADGVIIATATGSTAYALSAGGPPIDPRLRAVVVVPLAPHAVLTRPIVLPEAVTVRVTVVRGRSFCAADGHVEVPLSAGTTVTVSPGPELSVVRLQGSPGFLDRLREKMRLGLTLKQSDGVDLGTDTVDAGGASPSERRDPGRGG